MPTLSLEERLAAVETKLEQLEQRTLPETKGAELPWWERFVGIYTDNPEFEEAVRYGQKWRASEDNFAEEGAV